MDDSWEMAVCMRHVQMSRRKCVEVDEGGSENLAVLGSNARLALVIKHQDVLYKMAKDKGGPNQT